MGMLTMTTDKPLYNTGDTVTLTITGPLTRTDHITIKDDAGDTGTGDITVIIEPEIDDPASRVWTLKSNDGTTAIYTGLA